MRFLQYILAQEKNILIYSISKLFPNKFMSYAVGYPPELTLQKPPKQDGDSCNVFPELSQCFHYQWVTLRKLSKKKRHITATELIQ